MLRLQPNFRSGFLLLALTLIVFLSGCAGTAEEATPQEPPATAAAQPTQEEEKTAATTPRPYPSLKTWAETLGKNPRFVCCLDYAPQELQF